MIKLIASDMDGTLLDGEGNVPPETFDLIKRLRTAGIGFVASSGRRFDTLQELFAPVCGEMDFVASNGAQVVVAGQLVDREVFSHAALRRLKDVVDLFDGLHLVVFDRKISYLLDDEERFERELDKNLPNPLRVRDLLAFARVQPLMIRTTDTAVYTGSCASITEKKVSDLRNRVKTVNDAAPELLVSIH